MFFINDCIEDIKNRFVPYIDNIVIIINDKKILEAIKNKFKRLSDNIKVKNINDFLYLSTKLLLVDDFTLVLILREVITSKSINITIKDSYILLSMYNYIDNNLIYKEDFKEDYYTNYYDILNLHFDVVVNIYTIFTKLLIKRKIGYTGLIYRYLYDKINNLELSLNYFYIFIGFNFPTTIQRNVLLKLLNKNIIYIYWDLDIFYIRNSEDKVGSFLKILLEDVKPYININFLNNMVSKNKKIKIYNFTELSNSFTYINELLIKYLHYNYKTLLVVFDHNYIDVNYDFISNNFNLEYSYYLSNNAISFFILKLFELYYYRDNHGNFQVKHILNIFSSNYLLLYRDDKIDNFIDFLLDYNDEFISYNLIKSKIDFSILLTIFTEHICSYEILNTIKFFIKKFIKFLNILSIEYKILIYILDEISKLYRFNNIKCIYNVISYFIENNYIIISNIASNNVYITDINFTNNLNFDNIIFFGFKDLNIYNIQNFKYQFRYISIYKNIYIPDSILELNNLNITYLIYRLIQRSKNTIFIPIENNLVEDYNNESIIIEKLKWEYNYYIFESNISSDIYQIDSESKIKDLDYKFFFKEYIINYLKEGISYSNFISLINNNNIFYIKLINNNYLNSNILNFRIIYKFFNFVYKNIYHMYADTDINIQYLSYILNNLNDILLSYKIVFKNINDICFNLVLNIILKILNRDILDIKKNNIKLISIFRKYNFYGLFGSYILNLKTCIDRIDIYNGQKRIISYLYSPFTYKSEDYKIENIDFILKNIDYQKYRIFYSYYIYLLNNKDFNENIELYIYPVFNSNNIYYKINTLNTFKNRVLFFKKYTFFIFKNFNL